MIYRHILGYGLRNEKNHRKGKEDLVFQSVHPEVEDYDSDMISRRTFVLAAGALAATAALADDGQAGSSARPTMLTRLIHSSGQAIPSVGMGTWQTFDESPADQEAIKRLGDVLRAFHDAGGRVIDSSPMYGRSEEVVGQVSESLGVNADLFVATKVWTRGRQQGIDQMRDSLRKLRREKIELMQIHNLVDWQTHLATLREWKAAGTFRHIGITHYQHGAFDDLEKIIKAEKIDFVQLPYSVDVRAAEARLIPAAHDHNVAILVMRPFGGGNLFTKVRGQPVPDHVKPYASTWAQAFLKFLLANESITCVLPATSKPTHMADNVQAGFGRLPDEAERKKLIEAIA